MEGTQLVFGDIGKPTRRRRAVAPGVRRRPPGGAYLDLARWFAPRRIASRAGRVETAAVVAELDARPKLGKGQRDYRDALIALVAEYDLRQKPGHAPAPTPSAERPAVALTRLMRERGIGQQAVASGVGVTRGYVSMLVRGERPIPAELAVKLAAYLGVPAATLG